MEVYIFDFVNLARVTHRPQIVKVVYLCTTSNFGTFLSQQCVYAPGIELSPTPPELPNLYPAEQPRAFFLTYFLGGTRGGRDEPKRARGNRRGACPFLLGCLLGELSPLGPDQAGNSLTGPGTAQVCRDQLGCAATSPGVPR